MVSGFRSARGRAVGGGRAVLAPLGLRLSPAKIPRLPPRRGVRLLGLPHPAAPKEGNQQATTSTPTRRRRRLLSITAKVRALTNRSRHKTLADLLRQLNSVLRGWCNYFRHGVSSSHLPLPGPVRLAPGHAVAAQTAPRDQLEDSTGAFLTGRPGRRPAEGRDRIVRSPAGEGHPLPLAGLPASQHHGRAANRRNRVAQRESVERRMRVRRRTSGAEGGPGKRAGHKAGTAPRSDPYSTGESSQRFAEAGGSPIQGTTVTAEAAPTTAERVGTTRRCGSV